MRKAILPSHRLDQLMRFDPVECDRAFAKFKCAAVHEGRAAVPAGPDGTDWRTKDQIADHFRCSYRTVGNLMQRRVLPFVKLGNVVRFDFAECEAIMARAKTASVYDR